MAFARKQERMNNDLWYALKVRPRSESIVADHLSAKGYSPFLPTYQSRRRWSDRIKTIDLPLFPGYLFCQFDVNKRMPILTTPGVGSIVGLGPNPAPIETAEIESIRTVVSAGVAYTPHPYLKTGQVVRIERGALMGLHGMVTEVKNELRLILSVNLLMRSVSIEIDRTWVEPVRSASSERFLPVRGNKASAGVLVPR
jgi:transcription antitermination factor NusG